MSNSNTAQLSDNEPGKGAGELQDSSGKLSTNAHDLLLMQIEKLYEQIEGNIQEIRSLFKGALVFTVAFWAWYFASTGFELPSLFALTPLLIVVVIVARVGTLLRIVNDKGLHIGELEQLMGVPPSYRWEQRKVPRMWPCVGLRWGSKQLKKEDSAPEAEAGADGAPETEPRAEGAPETEPGAEGAPETEARGGSGRSQVGSFWGEFFHNWFFWVLLVLGNFWIGHEAPETRNQIQAKQHIDRIRSLEFEGAELDAYSKKLEAKTRALEAEIMSIDAELQKLEVQARLKAARQE